MKYKFSLLFLSMAIFARGQPKPKLVVNPCIISPTSTTVLIPIVPMSGQACIQVDPALIDKTTTPWTLRVSTASGTDPLDLKFRPVQDTNAAHYPANIWVTNSLAKVLQNAGAPGTDHWATLFATKNETQAFQVHAQGPIAALTITMSDLVNAQTGARILAASTDIVVYAERYMNVTIKTATGSTFLNTIGQIPDILIPAVDPYYHQPTNAFPIALAAGNNQSAWIDVHIPPTVPSGYYAGTVTVSDGGAKLTSMPITYAVWNWSMPSTSSLPSYTAMSYGGFCNQVYGSIAGCSAYPGSLGASDFGVTMTQVDAAVQMLDHRYSIGGATNVYLSPNTWDFTAFDSIYGPLFDGTPAHVAGILKGAKLTSYSLSLLGGTAAAGTKAFQAHFAAKGWVTPLTALCDEPPAGCSWANLLASGNLEHTYSSPVVPNMVTVEMTRAILNGVTGAVDIMVPAINSLEPQGAPMEDLALYKAWIAENSAIRRFWSYQSCSSADTCQNGRTGPVDVGLTGTYPNYDVDGKPVANRIMEWMTYLHGQTGELYYYVDVCDAALGVSTLCGVTSGVNPHPNPIISNYYSGGWGDGTLMYPGSTAYAGTPIPIWLPSMRLKHIRDGMQDYEYLNALQKLGQGLFVDSQVKSLITNSYTFVTDPVAFESVREALGTKLHQLAH